MKGPICYAMRCRWVRPSSLGAALRLLQSLDAAHGGHAAEGDTVKVVGGNTAGAIYKGEDAAVCVDVSRVAELHSVSLTSAALVLGGACTIAQLVEAPA